MLIGLHYILCNFHNPQYYTKITPLLQGTIITKLHVPQYTRFDIMHLFIALTVDAGTYTIVRYTRNINIDFKLFQDPYTV